MGTEDILAKLGGEQGKQGGIHSILKLFGGNDLRGLASQLTQKGMGDHFKSWVGHGQNQSISGEQIRQAANPQMLGRLAEQAHMTPEQTSEAVAKVLPEMVNKATPDGQMPAEDPFAKMAHAVRLSGLVRYRSRPGELEAGLARPAPCSRYFST